MKKAKAKALDTRPELYADLIPVWNTFMELNNSRDIGMSGPSGLRASDVAACLDLGGIHDADTRSEWYRLIRALDATFLEHVRTKQNG